MPFMKVFRSLALATLVLAFTPTLFAAEFGVRAGRYQDAGENFVGADLLFDLGSININPNIEYSLADNVTAGSANIDLTLDVGRFSRFQPFVGAGAGLWYEDRDAGGNTTDLLGNLIGGVKIDLDFLKPYAQVKYSRILDTDQGGGEGDDLALTVGLRF